MRKIVDVLVERDGMTVEEANSLVGDAVADFTDRLSDGELPMNICEKWFGLEPDYLVEFMGE